MNMLNEKPSQTQQSCHLEFSQNAELLQWAASKYFLLLYSDPSKRKLSWLHPKFPFTFLLSWTPDKRWINRSMHLTKHRLNRAHCSSESFVDNLFGKEFYLCNKGTVEHHRVNGFIFASVFHFSFLFFSFLAARD
jgi:hypothetical protein